MKSQDEAEKLSLIPFSDICTIYNIYFHIFHLPCSFGFHGARHCLWKYSGVYPLFVVCLYSIFGLFDRFRLLLPYSVVYGLMAHPISNANAQNWKVKWNMDLLCALNANGYCIMQRNYSIEAVTSQSQYKISLNAICDWRNTKE